MDPRDIDALRQALRWLVAGVIIWFLTSCTTADPYGNPMSNRMTADAALQLAEYQEHAMTETAQAPIINLTQTAAGLIVQQTQVSIDMTSTAVLWTPTITPTSTPNAEATIKAAEVIATVTAINLKAERDIKTNNLKAFWSYVAGTAVLIMVVFGGYVVFKRFSYKSADVDESGKVRPVISVIDGTVTEIERMPNYRGTMANDDVIKQMFIQWFEQRFGVELKPSLPPITPERQDSTTQRAQLTDLATRTSNNSSIRRAVANEMEKHLSTSNLESRFKVLGPGDSAGEIIDDEIMNVLDAEWKEVQE